MNYTYNKNIIVHIVALYMYVYSGYISVVFKVFKNIYYTYNMNILRVYPIWSINVMYFIGFSKHEHFGFQICIKKSKTSDVQQ